MRMRLIVRGHSMRPAFQQGDVIVVSPAAPIDIKVGSVIVFDSKDRAKGRRIAHRVIRVQKEHDQLRWITRGDNNSLSKFETVFPDQLVGKVVARYKDKQIATVSRIEEITWLMVAPLFHYSRLLRFRLATILFPRLWKWGLIKFVPITYIQVGERQIALALGRIIAIQTPSPKRLIWIHPLFVNMRSNLWPDSQ